MELLLALVAGVLYATGLFLMLRRRLAQMGRARVMQQYSDDAIAQRTIAFWKEILGDT